MQAFQLRGLDGRHPWKAYDNNHLLHERQVDVVFIIILFTFLIFVCLGFLHLLMNNSLDHLYQVDALPDSVEELHTRGLQEVQHCYNETSCQVDVVESEMRRGRSTERSERRTGVQHDGSPSSCRGLDAGWEKR